MQDYTDTRPSPLRNYLGEPGTRPPALGGTLCDEETEGPQCHCHGAHGSPSPVLPLPPLRERKIRGQTKASPPAGGPGLD